MLILSVYVIALDEAPSLNQRLSTIAVYIVIFGLFTQSSFHQSVTPSRFKSQQEASDRQSDQNMSDGFSSFSVFHPSSCPLEYL
jgi:hypothetical protein